jgi:uncharacterized protein
MDLKGKKIAVIGVSARIEKFGFKIFKDLLSAGLTVYGVNPRGGEVLGKKIYKSLKDIEIIPDLVITVVSPEVTEKIVEECNLLQIKEIWMQPGSESENAIKQTLSYGISLTHNACLMKQAGIW